MIVLVIEHFHRPVEHVHGRREDHFAIDDLCGQFAERFGKRIDGHGMPPFPKFDGNGTQGFYGMSVSVERDVPSAGTGFEILGDLNVTLWRTSGSAQETEVSVSSVFFDLKREKSPIYVAFFQRSEPATACVPSPDDLYVLIRGRAFRFSETSCLLPRIRLLGNKV